MNRLGEEDYRQPTPIPQGELCVLEQAVIYWKNIWETLEGLAEKKTCLSARFIEYPLWNLSFGGQNHSECYGKIAVDFDKDNKKLL